MNEITPSEFEALLRSGEIRLARLCACPSGDAFAYRNEDGDLMCAACGHQRAGAFETSRVPFLTRPRRAADLPRW